MYRPLRSTLSAVALVIAFAATSAHAATLTYNFAIDAPNGYPLTHVTMYATDGVSEDLFLSPVTFGPSGVFQLTHTVGFTPSAAMIIALTDRDKDDNFDLVMFVNDAFAAAATGNPYSVMFPAGAPNLGHNVLGHTLAAAHAGDIDALAAVLGHVRGPSSAAAYFSPFGSYSITQFTVAPPPIGGDIPSPASASLALVGLGGLLIRRRRHA